MSGYGVVALKVKLKVQQPFFSFSWRIWIGIEGGQVFSIDSEELRMGGGQRAADGGDKLWAVGTSPPIARIEFL